MPHLFLSLPEYPHIVPRAAHVLPLEERDVEYRRVVVHKLEEVYLEGQGVVELCLSAQEFLFRQPLC